MTELLLERGADPAAENWLAFNFAVRFGSVLLVRRLLDLGADPGVQDDDDPTPLMEAVGRGNRELVQLLLDAGADPQQTAEGGANGVRRGGAATPKGDRRAAGTPGDSLGRNAASRRSRGGTRGWSKG